MILFARCPLMRAGEVKRPGWACPDLLSPAFTVISTSLGCRRAAGMHYCKSLSDWRSLQVLLRAWDIPDPVLSECWQPAMHLCELDCRRSEDNPESSSAVSCSELSWGDNVARDALLHKGLGHLMCFFWGPVSGEEQHSFWAVPPRIPNVQSMPGRGEH